jgi:hypothetical protein
MPYKFSFDLSRISKSFFKEVAKVAHEKNMHRRMGEKAKHLAEKFKIREITGLDVADAITLVEDLVDIYVKNLSDKEKFQKVKRRALFLPHCSRKYMDNRCQAVFDPKIPSYVCAHCSPDCLVNQGTTFGQKKGYDVYVLPGGSCILKLLKNNFYEGIVGVACSEELKMADKVLTSLNLVGQAVPLAKNGCANTSFSIESLEKVL